MRLFARSTQTEALTMKPHLQILKILTKVIIGILKCIGKEVGIATDNPKVLTYACVIRGKEEIEKELLHGNGKQLEYI